MFERASQAALWITIPVGIACAQAGGEAPLTVRAETVSAITNSVVRLTIDFAKPVTLSRPASTVIIGNSAVAQAGLSDDRTLIITGKMPGRTNLIVFASDGEEVANLVLDVTASDDRLVIVRQGMGRTTFKCNGGCDPVLAVGDDAAHFDTTAAQTEGRNSVSAPAGDTQ